MSNSLPDNMIHKKPLYGFLHYEYMHSEHNMHTLDSVYKIPTMDWQQYC